MKTKMFSIEHRGVRIEAPYELEAIEFCLDVLNWRINLLKEKRNKRRKIVPEAPLPSMFALQGEVNK